MNLISGDGEFYSGGSFTNPTEFSSRFCSIDVFSPARKRARISAPSPVQEPEFKQSSIEVLPDECLMEILKRVNGGRERSFCACVSKQWLTLLTSIRSSEFHKSSRTYEETSSVSCDDVEMGSTDEHDGFLTRVLDGKKATDLRLAAIAVGTSGHGGLGKLSIRGSNSYLGVTNFGLSAIARGCPSLKSLSLWNVPGVGDEGLYEVSKECHLLEKLDLSHCSSVSSKALIAVAQSCKNLTSLSIESCANVGNEGLQAIGKLCPKLQCVSIKDCPLVGDQGVSSLLSSAFSILMKVKLQALNITDFSLAVIGHYGRGLTSLTLSCLNNVTEKGFWVMANAQGLQKLSSLVIASCTGVTDVSLEAVGKGCASLKHACFRRCCSVSDNGLLGLARSARSLESLQLEECNRITLSGVLGVLSNLEMKLKSLTLIKCIGIKDVLLDIPLLKPCTSLRSLSIQNCPGVGSRSLAMLSKLCPRIEHVNLIGLCGVTDAGVIQLVEGCEVGLVKVCLSGCLNLTDEVVLALTRLHGKTLELINLDGCMRITDASLVAVACNCIFLSDLDVSRCSITDSGVAALSCAEQLNLQVLSLSGCVEVSSNSFGHLKKMGKTLLGLNLQHCRSISSKAMERLIETLWRCDILS